MFRSKKLTVLFFLLALFANMIPYVLASEPIVLNMGFVKENFTERPVRVVLAGDSITWGGGLLDSGFVGVVDDYIRKNLATTIMPESMKITGEHKTIKNPKFYGGVCAELIGKGSSCEFELFGNELSLCVVRERGNATAAEVEVFADGKSLGSFNTLNNEETGSDKKEFKGDGKSVKFDLGRCFTYAHNVSLDGKKLSGKHNTQGYGGKFSKDDDYMVVRKYFYKGKGKKPEVHHILWLREAPGKGTKISVAFDYGENIMYAKTTITETSGIDSKLESAFGDGQISFDPARPSRISSGLDFRSSDQRSVVTYKFGDYKKRNFKLVVKKNAAGKNVNPKFLLNFATNRFHHIMNAGIGGWRASAFLKDRGLRSWKEVMEFNPDIVFLGLGTNDDWSADNTFIAYRTVKEMSEKDLRDISSIWVRDFSANKNGFDVNVSMLKIADISKNSVTIDKKNVCFDKKPEVGDVLIIGDYFGDNRTVETREIDKWNVNTFTATFKDELKPSGFFGLKKLADLKGQDIRIKRTPGFIKNMEECIKNMRSVNKNLVLGIEDTGYSNYRARLLFAYPLRLKKLARKFQGHHVNLYDDLEKWVYSRELNIPAFIDTPGNTTSSGASEYDLVTKQGHNLFARLGLRRNFSVKVNGIERFGDGCHVDGGIAWQYKKGVDLSKLKMKPWAKLPRTCTDYKAFPAKLVFTSNPPAKGDKIEVICSRDKWSGDDCHMNSNGSKVYGAALGDALKGMIKAK